jgi:WNK lysine deficient protein kinase
MVHKSGSLECPVPEVADGHIGTAADIYCFGMVMLEMITLKLPYAECVNQAQIYKRIYSHIGPMTL